VIIVDGLYGEVNEVEATMAVNIEKALDRSERLDDLAKKSEDLSNQAMMFQVL